MTKAHIAKTALNYRLNLLASLLGGSSPNPNYSADSKELIVEVLQNQSSSLHVWLTQYIVRGAMPTVEETEQSELRIHRDGSRRWLEDLLSQPVHQPDLRFEVVEGITLVDVFHTAKTDLATGIQRVAKETATQWANLPNTKLVAWNDHWEYLRWLSPEESEKFGVDNADLDSATALVPIRSKYILLELIADPVRSSRAAAFIDASASEFHAVTFDCVPIVSSETTGYGMPYVFAVYLDLLARANKIAPISTAAATDFEGWKTALAATGRSGPIIQEVSLAAEATPSPKETVDKIFDEWSLTKSLPLVTCVGSHEPRKNHQAVLRSAEQLWKAGEQFQLVFIGGNSWGSEYFELSLKRLQQAGYPVVALSKISDQHMYAAVSTSIFTVFPSLNEGFGLPVAESILLNTPVITSNFGSMRSIAEGYGGYLIDPRNDEDLTAAMRTLLRSDEQRAALKAQTHQFPQKTWATYAAEVLEVFQL